MINVRYEKLDASRQAKAGSAVSEAFRLASSFRLPAHQAVLQEWFGQDAENDAGLKANLQLMQRVLGDSNRTITFVERSGGVLKVDYNPDNVRQPPVLMPPGSAGAGLGGVFGYAFPTDARGQSETATHVGSGMRIYLGPAFGSGSQIEDVQTVYHEMTHKVLGTNDHQYGPAGCRAMAQSDPARARRNADSYAYFATSLGTHRW